MPFELVHFVFGQLASSIEQLESVFIHQWIAKRSKSLGFLHDDFRELATDSPAETWLVTPAVFPTHSCNAGGEGMPVTSGTVAAMTALSSSSSTSTTPPSQLSYSSFTSESSFLDLFHFSYDSYLLIQCSHRPSEFELSDFFSGTFLLPDKKSDRRKNRKANGTQILIVMSA
jgi:hypothetical protein